MYSIWYMCIFMKFIFFYFSAYIEKSVHSSLIKMYLRQGMFTSILNIILFDIKLSCAKCEPEGYTI